MLFKALREKRSLIRNGIGIYCPIGYMGVMKTKRSTQVIISLTSHPGRIDVVHKTIISLLNQTEKPDRIILWLANEQFRNRELDLPKRLLLLTNHGLEIKWYKDIRSYKKLIPTILCFPNEIIVTVDDDWYYHKTMLEVLLLEHSIHPTEIISSEVTHPFFNENGYFVSSHSTVNYNGKASFYNKLLGGTGTLYPPNALDKEVFKEERFLALAPTNDDIWFWAMAVKNGTKIRVPENPVHPFAMTAPEIQRANSLDSINSSQNLYIETTNKIFEFYPEIKERLLQAEE